MKVLLAEDDSAASLPLKKLLFKWGFDVMATSNGLDAWQILQTENAPQLAILDWTLPYMDGPSICRSIREQEKTQDRYTYVVMLTPKHEKCDIVEGLEAGADDYVVRPFDKDEMRARLYAGQRIVEVQMALRVANRRLLIMSRLDPLTGALSRNAILDDLDLAMYRAGREKKSLTVSLVDIDNLRAINERYGRTTGDQILQDSVRRINTSVRRTDSFGRYGADEFLVILLGADAEQGLIVGERIQTAICDEDFLINSHSLHVTVSQTMMTWDGQKGVKEFVASLEESFAAGRTRGANRIDPAA